MNLWRLVARSLWFYRRTNAAVLLAVVVATAVLTGALAVGDSVQYTLRRIVGARLGLTEFAVTPQGRFFRAKLADELQQSLGGDVAPVLQVVGIVTNDDGSRRINRVQVLGVDDRFYAIGAGQNPLFGHMSDGTVVSESVARELRVAAGDEIVLRVEKPGLMPRDIPLVSDKDRTVASRLKVAGVAGEGAFGRFDLQANQAAPFNVFVPLAWLGEQIEQPGRADMLLAAGLAPATTAEQVNEAVRKTWQLADAGLELRRLEPQNALELRSRRVFIDTSIGDGAMRAEADAAGILTYFVNEIRLGDKATPYSMVAAVGGDTGLLPPNMADDEIVINQWLADDLGAAVGDSLELAYYVIGPNRKLSEEQRPFKVVKVLPLEGPAKDPDLMPDFPGLADVENCRDWKPGIPIDLDRIRPKDEQYWDDFRGTPKAFMTLHAGQAIWRNRYGDLTAVRYPWREGLAQEIDRRLRSEIDPAAVGLFFQPVRERGLRAGRGGTDFGGLFLGLSMFLIGSAVALTGLLFVFGVESRRPQVGMLLAVGWPVRRVKRLLLAEGGLVSLVGTILGAGVGLLYTALMVHGLSSFWSGAIGGAEIRFHADTSSLFIGAFSGLCAALLAIWITLRKHVTRPAHELLTGDTEQSPPTRMRFSRGRLGVAVAVVSFAGAGLLAVFGSGGDSQAMAGMFFGAGALLLCGGLALSHTALRVARAWNRPMVSLGGLGIRNATRRSGRSLAVIGLLACGVFLVVSVQVFHQGPVQNPQRRDSGTGGFTLYAESSVPVLYDLNSEAGRRELGLAGDGLDGVTAVQFRLREGDDASCLNLNRAQQPRLLGVQPAALAERKAFTFKTKGKGWDLLRTDLDDGAVPAIGDEPTVTWALGKKVGDEIEYTDEMGRPFRVRIVGVLAGSVLQGTLLIDESRFTTRFPSVDGYRLFLIDAPADRMDAVAQELSSGLKDYGLTVTPAKERLAAFAAVENTYLSIFTVLGGLGLVLGSVGLGLVVLRNMLERRGELAMLRAVGFDRGRIRRMVFDEHWPLVLAGLACGVLAAVVAVAPALQSPGGQIPYASLVVLVAAIALSGAAWVWIAATLALRGELLDALRNE
jgi:putative ABC transport system permease protein